MAKNVVRNLLHLSLPLTVAELAEVPSTVAETVAELAEVAPSVVADMPVSSIDYLVFAPSATVALALSLLLAGMYDQTFSSKGCLWTGGAALLSFFAAAKWWVPAEEEREQLTLPLLGFLGLLALLSCTLMNFDQHVIRRGAGFLSAYVCLTLAIDLAHMAAAQLAMLLALLSQWGVAALLCRGVIALLLSRHAITLLLRCPTAPPHPAAGWLKSLRAIKFIQRISNSTPSLPKRASFKGLAQMATMSRRISTPSQDGSPAISLSRKEEISLAAIQQFYRRRLLQLTLTLTLTLTPNPDLTLTLTLTPNPNPNPNPNPSPNPNQVPPPPARAASQACPRRHGLRRLPRRREQGGGGAL